MTVTRWRLAKIVLYISALTIVTPWT